MNKNSENQENTTFENAIKNKDNNESKKILGQASPEIIKQYIIDLAKKYGLTNKQDEHSETLKPFQDFFKIFEKYKYATKISMEDFDEIISTIELPISTLLKSKYFIENYPEPIKQKILEDSKNFELLIEHCIEETSYHFPENITKDDWQKLFQEYIIIDSTDAKYINNLGNLLENNPFLKKYIEIYPEDKIKIEDTLNEKYRLIREAEPSISISPYLVETNPNEENFDKFFDLAKKMEEHIYHCETGEDISSKKPFPFPIYIDNLNSISNNIPEILSYFTNDKYMFDEGISTLPSFPNREILIFASKYQYKNSKKFYKYNRVFEMKHFYMSCKLNKLIEKLDSLNLTLEEIISEFFSDYSKNKFDVSWLSLEFPKKDNSFQHKTKLICSNEEEIRKQFQLLIKHNEIDRRLYNHTEYTPSIEELGSFISKKYAYLKSDESFDCVLFLLFSYGSPLRIIEKTSIIVEDTFVDLISEHQLKHSDFTEEQLKDLKILININLISDIEDYYQFVNPPLIKVLKKLYYYGETSYINSSTEEQEILDYLANVLNLVEFDSRLFSRSESDYLNFLLNNKKYLNSWAIRNNYQHGAPIYNSKEKYENDYYHALMVLIIYIVKINEELEYKSSKDCS